ncbi:MAG: tripartite tricarboxylate transporter substrate binding protein [Pirellulaceae bacterium]|nr:tripartite tricarboxylate transporter substrate binding protein [Pirellulaceae bacterium]
MRFLMQHWIAFCVALTATAVGCGPQQPAEFPHKQMTIICPWAPGGGTDRVARHWAEQLRKEFGQPCVVTNKQGGSGSTGHSSGAFARADGHTLTIVTFELCTMHTMKITDLTHEQFAPILQMNADPAAIIVRKDAKWNSIKELLDDAKANPGKLKMSGTATKGAWDLARVGLQQTYGVPKDAIIWTPNQGAAPSLTELLGGHIDAVCCSVPEAAPQIENGDLRVLCVMGDERLESFPEFPTCKEEGIDWVVVGWRGLAAPKDTPPETLAKLRATCEEVAKSEAYAQFMKKNGFGVEIRVGDEFAQFLAEQDRQWSDVIKAAGYDVE